MPRQPDFPPERTDAPLLRDLLGTHAESLARVLREHLAAGVSHGGHAFDTAARLSRGRGPGAYAAWLGGAALGLLRDTGGLLDAARPVPAPGETAADAPRPIHPRLAAALSRAVPADLAGSLLRLARSGLDEPACVLFLCKPVNATQGPIRIQK